MARAVVVLCSSAAVAVLSSCSGHSVSDWPPDQKPSGWMPATYTESIAVEDQGSPLPDQWWKRAVFYELHVRSFKDSDGDGQGDLPGLISKLDYLHDLGVTALYLLPITRNSDHYHGYTIVDFRDVDPDYGTLADLSELVARAHALGMAVVLDFVGEYSSPVHPFFLDAVDFGGYRDFYLWAGADPGWPNPFFPGSAVWYPPPHGSGYYYSMYFGQPAFDYRNPSVQAYMRDSLRFWLNAGADGFRFDSVSTLFVYGRTRQVDQPENHDYYRALRSDILDAYANRFTIAEDGDTKPYLGDGRDEFHAGFAVSWAQSVMTAIASEDATGLADALSYPDSAPAGSMFGILLANHDTVKPRAYTRFGGDEAKCKLAATVLLTSPGIPFVYYGEEIGMAVLADGHYLGPAPPWDDERLRSPMQWDASANAGFTTGTPYLGINDDYADHNVALASADDGSILARFRKMIAVRKGSDALSSGATAKAHVSLPGSSFAFVRSSGASKVVVVLNLSKSDQAVSINFANTPLDVTSGKAAASADLLDGATNFGDVTPSNRGGYSVIVPAQGARILPFTY